MKDQLLAAREESEYKAQKKGGPGRVGGAFSWFRLFRGALPIQLEQVSASQTATLCHAVSANKKKKLVESTDLRNRIPPGK